MAKLMEDGCVVLDPFEAHALDMVLRETGHTCMHDGENIDDNLASIAAWLELKRRIAVMYKELYWNAREQLNEINAERLGQ